MKSHIGLAKLCGWFGITRQAHYQHAKKASVELIKEDLVLDQVRGIRIGHRRMGTRKLYFKIKPFLQEHGIKMGRDKLFNLLADNALLIRRRNRRIKTTNSFHWLKKHPNLIKGIELKRPNQLWVSDITYWKILEKPIYISFITDAYSHKIVGHQLAQTLESVESMAALKMALSAFEGAEHHSQLIHHSDRGSQYCSSRYVSLLEQNNIQISMTENGDPRENAVAERLNGILKDEYLLEYQPRTFEEARRVLNRSVELYNVERPHSSVSNYTPNEVHSNPSLSLNRLWKNYYSKYYVKPEQDENQNVNPYQD